MTHLIGPKVAGSFENDKLAVDLILREINKIIVGSNSKQKIEVSIQNANGSFYLDYTPHGMTSVYQGYYNIIVKLRPASHEPKHSFMLNTHFDSVPVSPGAGDAGVLIAVLLETLRVLSLSEETFEHSIIMLLNGAEENGLQASHAFIDQHEWAKDIRAFINLDSAGNGGKEVLFQADPKNPWLMNVRFISYCPWFLFTNNYIFSITVVE